MKHSSAFRSSALLFAIKISQAAPSAEGKGIIVGGANYGQGFFERACGACSALSRCKGSFITKSFARIHCANLINAGILPLDFKNEDDYDKISLGDELVLPDIKKIVESGKDVLIINKTTGEDILAKCELTDRTKAIIIAGGLLNYTKENS